MIKNIRGLVFHGKGKIEFSKNIEDIVKFTVNPDQLLIQVKYAPMNPSDYLFYLDLYADKKPLPAIPGFEGYGIVTQAGKPENEHFIGKFVSFLAFDKSVGSYCSHVACSTKSVVVLEKEPNPQTFEFLVNPLTAIGLLDKAKQHGSHAIVQNGASSSMGKLILFFNSKINQPSINIVRNAKHFDELKSLGATEVLDSTDPHFNQNLIEVIKKYTPTSAFDCVGGKMTGQLLKALPHASIQHVYGALEMKPCEGITPLDLIFTKKELKGFHLMKNFMNEDTQLSTYEKEINQLTNEFKQLQGVKIFELEQFEEALKYYPTKNEKILFKCS